MLCDLPVNHAHASDTTCKTEGEEEHSIDWSNSTDWSDSDPWLQCLQTGGSALQRKVALSQFARCGCKNHTGGHKRGVICSFCVGVQRTAFEYMGYSLRSPRGWRCTGMILSAPVLYTRDIHTGHTPHEPVL